MSMHEADKDGTYEESIIEFGREDSPGQGSKRQTRSF